MPALSGKKKEIELQGKNHTHVIKFSKSKGRVVLVSNKKRSNYIYNTIYNNFSKSSSSKTSN